MTTTTFEDMEQELEKLIGEIDLLQADFLTRTNGSFERAGQAIQAMMDSDDQLDLAVAQAANEAEAAVEEYANTVAGEDGETATSD